MPMEWVRGKTIGHGSFAAVSLAKPTNQNSGFPPLMAVKSCGVSHSASLMNERLILEELKDCPEIIGCYGDSLTIENGKRLYNVALEYASGGALADKVKNSGSFRLSESEVQRYTNSILRGLHFIHRNGFVHCDIKLQNVLLVSDGVKDAVKIADFGLAKKAAGDLNSKYEIRGTPMYMAPETVVGGEQESASDIWALGCLVTEMITGNPVWNCSDFGALLMKIGIGAEIPEIPAKLSDDGKDFLGKCFLKDPKKRWTAEMLLNHPFINTVTYKEEAENQISPRDPFDFPDWESQQSSESSTEFDCWIGDGSEFLSGSPSIPPATRLGQLLTDLKPNWSVSSSWVKVR
ncbi:mitogen-activated protein kinase kinase kinase 17 [Cynara cardunculus var. scolymus]|uniref:Protein kinase, ATP binding site-containing protein n=1 Tax=Cynara cardunculus var. scolymus TaxID=59895 RepID=A0A103XKL9_CYNCS|nr:mitogen-activated protein kinase kinase kinase 17 [Cynara cardunculus var. scolymus]KVH92521.1 Protein kinase, ATP binding site-containing protein [Cynara cardunculus var. scolymus]